MISVIIQSMELFHTSFLASLVATSMAFAAPGTSVVKDAQGHYWFKTPKGELVFSLGINNIASMPFRPKPDTQFYQPVKAQFSGQWPAWSTSVRQMLQESNANTVGGWSDPAVAAGPGIWRTPILYTSGAESDRCLEPYRPGFESKVAAYVRESLAKYPDRSDILGVFLDNEMPWFGINGWDNTPNATLLERAIALPHDDDAYLAAIDCLKGRYGDIQKFNEAWKLNVKDWSDIAAQDLRTSSTDAANEDRTRFTSVAAERFYAVSAAEVRAQAPELLILGSRFAGDAPACVITSCGRHSDVVSVNFYSAPKVPERVLAKFYILTQKPLMLTEFSWRAKENQSGNPNTRGAGSVLLTQAERAAHYSEFVEDLATYPMVIGAHWFEWADQSPQGRFDGEDSNYGVVDISHGRYENLLGAMKQTNAKVAQLHASTSREIPTSIPEPESVTVRSTQQPGRPAQVELLGDWMHDPEIWGAADSKLTYTRDGAALKIEYSTGQSYGAGLSLHMPRSSRAAGSTEPVGDMDGYAQVVVDVEAPAGLEINFVLAEANSVKNGSSKNDDGEAFLSDVFAAKSGRQTYRVELSKFKLNQFHANQGGAKTIDMSSIGIIGLQFKGSPQTGSVVVHSFRLEK